MPKRNYQILLTPEENTILNDVRKNGHSSASTTMHANILLNTNASVPDKKKNNRGLAKIFDVTSTKYGKPTAKILLRSGSYFLYEKGAAH